MPQNVQILSNLNKKTVENYVNCIENLKDKIEVVLIKIIK